MKNRALYYFIKEKQSCTVAIAKAWQDEKSDKKHRAENVKDAGHGTAESGMCGALYAALKIGGKELENDIKKDFTSQTKGFSACRDIRKNRALPCTKCVTKAAEILENYYEKMED